MRRKLRFLFECLCLVAAFRRGAAFSQEPAARIDFESDAIGQFPKAFSKIQGKWVIAQEGDNRVLLQLAENRLEVFNVALLHDRELRDVDLTVRIQSVKGENERGGGLVWRAQDKDNYYVARYNPYVARHNAKKGANFTLFKVENGKRTQLDYADAPAEPLVVIPEDPMEPPPEWHTIRITMKGNDIVGYLDDKKLLQAEDTTFSTAGKIGVATKSDARTYFDDLMVEDLGARK